MLALGKSTKQIENKKNEPPALQINYEEILAGINLVDLADYS